MFSNRRIVSRFTKFVRAAFALILVLALAGQTLAAAKISFKAPAGVTMSDLRLDVYKGFPTASSITEDTLASLDRQPSNADGSFTLTESGTYCCYVRGEGYYSICKLFQVKDGEDQVIELATGKIAGTGFEPCNPNLTNVPGNYGEMLDRRDKILGIWTDEILAHFGTDGLVGYIPFSTPAFTTTKALHEVSSQQDMMNFINSVKASASTNMYVHILGQTANYKYDVPMVVFTTSNIPEGATIKQIGEILRGNGKPTVWEQSQIHPNEPAAGEGALVMIQEMAGSYGQSLLDKINVVIIPRVNPDGSYLFTRVTWSNFDMNRDHMALKSKELALIHTAFRNIMPELVIDDHEFTFYGANKDGYMNNAYDIEVTPASSLNNSAAVNSFAMNTISTKIHTDLAAAGLRNYHYGYTVNNPIGRAYYGLFNSVSILVETRGIGAGRTNFERRIFSHVVAAKSMLKSAADNAQTLRNMVADARQEIINKGRTYDEGDVLALYQTASGSAKTPFLCTQYKFNMDGTPTAPQEKVPLNMNDTIERGRPRPTAYIMPKGEAWVDKALYILDNQGAEYYEIAAGTPVTAQQYYYIGEYTNKAGNKVGFEAGLRDAAEVTFENGAIVVPMDQVAGNVIAMTFEPDVNDSNGYDGTLVQYGVVSSDANRNFPYYRFTANNPRTALPPAGSGTSGGTGSGGGCATFPGLLIVVLAPTAFLLKKRR